MTTTLLKTLIKPYITPFLAVVAAVGLAVAVARCHGPAPAQAVVQKTEGEKTKAEDTKINTRKDAEKYMRKVQESYRKDGSVRSRTVVDAGAKVKTEVQTVTVVKEVEKIKTVTVVTPRAPALGVSITPLWDRLQAKPTEINASVDFKVGRVLGVDLRAGPAVRWRDKATPDAYGATLRGEF